MNRCWLASSSDRILNFVKNLGTPFQGGVASLTIALSVVSTVTENQKKNTSISLVHWVFRVLIQFTINIYY